MSPETLDLVLTTALAWSAAHAGQCKQTIRQAGALLRSGGVTPTADPAVLRVASMSEPSAYYLVRQHCTCRGSQRAYHGLCTHLLAAKLYRVLGAHTQEESDAL